MGPDARARRVYLTKAGIRLVDTIRESVDRVEIEILGDISNEELDQAANTLRKMKDRLLAMVGNDDGGKSETED